MEKYCTLLVAADKALVPTQQEIMAELEQPDIQTKTNAIKKVLLALLNGERIEDSRNNKLLMSVIRYCLTTEDHQLKKLLMLYWESVEKYDSAGKLLPEMILVCNALRNDLNHPNEFIRAASLRFMCKLNEPELLEPLVASIKTHLKDPIPYVKRNAVLAIHTIFRQHPDLVPDAPEMIEEFLQAETDMTARRNGFLMLYHSDYERAVSFLADKMDDVARYGDGFQLVVLELARKVCRGDPSSKAFFIRAVYQLLDSGSAAVSYEAAWTLVSLSSAPTAVRAAASTYARLLVAQSDNNVKLIVLERLAKMKVAHLKVLQEIVMEILRALVSPNSEIRRKTLAIAMDCVSPRNIDEVVLVLKKEIVKTQDKTKAGDGAGEYRQMLIQAIHACAVKFPEVAKNVVHLLLDFLGAEGTGALDVILFVREIMQSYEEIRDTLRVKIIDALGEIRSSRVFRVALWILGEYSEAADDIKLSYDAIADNLGKPPFTKAQVEQQAAEESKDDEAKAAATPQTRVTVLADGTYATQTSVSEAAPGGGGAGGAGGAAEELTPLRKLLVEDGDFFLGVTAAATMAKLVVKLGSLEGSGGWAAPDVKGRQIQAMEALCSILELGRLKAMARDAGPGSKMSKMDQDSMEQAALHLRVLCDPAVTQLLSNPLVRDCRRTFRELLEERHATEKKNKTKDDEAAEKAPKSQPDDLLVFRQLRARNKLGANEVDLDDEGDLLKATGVSADEGSFSYRLNRVHQLTGFDDPVYAEAYVTVHDYDIVLEVMVMNRTPDTLANLTVELYTLGDLKLVERPHPQTLGAFESATIRANIKVSSTETGHIFGNIVYDAANSADKTVLNLNDINIDIMDYIVPASCSEQSFRSMWAEFEWENKVAVNTSIVDVKQFLAHVVSITNMRCLTPQTALEGDSPFIAANLYARSIFGEDALVNVSVERQERAKAGPRVVGYIRIRSKTQGIALSLGERITKMQKEPLKGSEEANPQGNVEAKGP